MSLWSVLMTLSPGRSLSDDCTTSRIALGHPSVAGRYICNTCYPPFPVGHFVPLLAWCRVTFSTVCSPLLQSLFGFLCHSCMALLLLSTLSFPSFLYQSYLMWCCLCCWHMNYIVDSLRFLALWIELKLLQVRDLALEKTLTTCHSWDLWLSCLVLIHFIRLTIFQCSARVWATVLTSCTDTSLLYLSIFCQKDLVLGTSPSQTFFFFQFLLLPLCLSVIARGTAYLHFVLLGKLFCLFLNIVEMKNAYLYDFTYVLHLKQSHRAVFAYRLY